MRTLLAVTALLFAALTGTGAAAAPPGPETEDQMGPEVTIIKRGEEIIEEYRIHGQLIMIKVTPRKGYSYYLVDTDGDGRMETHQGELTEDLLIPQWPLFKWR